MSRDWSMWLDDMMACCRNIIEHTRNVDRKTFSPAGLFTTQCCEIWKFSARRRKRLRKRSGSGIPKSNGEKSPG